MTTDTKERRRDDHRLAGRFLPSRQKKSCQDLPAHKFDATPRAGMSHNVCVLHVIKGQPNQSRRVPHGIRYVSANMVSLDIR